MDQAETTQAGKGCLDFVHLGLITLLKSQLNYCTLNQLLKLPLPPYKMHFRHWCI